jgi:hypothetical protein
MVDGVSPKAAGRLCGQPFEKDGQATITINRRTLAADLLQMAEHVTIYSIDDCSRSDWCAARSLAARPGLSGRANTRCSLRWSPLLLPNRR